MRKSDFFLTGWAVQSPRTNECLLQKTFKRGLRRWIRRNRFSLAKESDSLGKYAFIRNASALDLFLSWFFPCREICQRSELNAFELSELGQRSCYKQIALGKAKFGWAEVSSWNQFQDDYVYVRTTICLKMFGRCHLDLTFTINRGIHWPIEGLWIEYIWSAIRFCNPHVHMESCTSSRSVISTWLDILRSYDFCQYVWVPLTLVLNGPPSTWFLAAIVVAHTVTHVYRRTTARASSADPRRWFLHHRKPNRLCQAESPSTRNSCSGFSCRSADEQLTSSRKRCQTRL